MSTDVIALSDTKNVSKDRIFQHLAAVELNKP
jgi:hypothetical protein